MDDTSNKRQLILTLVLVLIINILFSGCAVFDCIPDKWEFWNW
jgi:hypothetical protein